MSRFRLFMLGVALSLSSTAARAGLLPVTVTVLPVLAVPKMSMLLELEMLMFETAVEADPNASMD